MINYIASAVVEWIGGVGNSPLAALKPGLRRSIRAAARWRGRSLQVEFGCVLLGSCSRGGRGEKEEEQQQKQRRKEREEERRRVQVN